MFLMNVNASLTTCTFGSNRADLEGGGLYLYSTTLKFLNIDLLHNIAFRSGGGIAMLHSYLKFYGRLQIESNKVTSESGKGAGIYMKDMPSDCMASICSLSWAGNAHVISLNNLARNGSIIYGGMMDRCSNFQNDTPTLPLIEIVSTNGSKYDIKSQGITSESIKVCYCESHLSDCEKRRINREIAPGQSLNVPVACLDQLEQPVPCHVRSEYKETEFNLGKGQNSRYINGCEKNVYHAYSKTAKSSVLEITGDIKCEQKLWRTLEINITIGQCPYAFQKINDSCHCDDRLRKIFTSIGCNIDTSSVVLKVNGWFSYDGGYLRVHRNCPLNYCSNKNATIPSNPNSLCANNRGGILCGGCLANSSVVLGSWKCMKCSHLSRYNFIWLIVVIALAGVAIILFLLLVKITVSSGTINGLVFYANILSFSGLLDDRACSIHPILRVFLSWINLDFGIEVCFY